MKGQKVAAVVEISAYREDAKACIASLSNLIEYFQEVHVVCPSDYEMPKVEDAKLKSKIVMHTDELVESRLNTALLVVYIQPDHAIEEAALELLMEQAMEKRSSCDHYAVRGKIDCQQQKYSFLLGFVWLITVFDQLRTWIHCWGYHVRDDLRASKITPHFPNSTTIHTYKHTWLFSCFSRIASIQYAQGSSLLQKPKDVWFAFRYAYNHPHMSGWNVQWWLFYVVYYVGLALPWWNFFISEPTYREASIRSSIYILFHWIAYRNVFNPFWLSLWGIHIVFVMWIVNSRYKHVHLMWVFLMPVYLTLSPIFFLVAKIKIFKSNK